MGGESGLVVSVEATTALVRVSSGRRIPLAGSMCVRRTGRLDRAPPVTVRCPYYVIMRCHQHAPPRGTERREEANLAI